MTGVNGFRVAAADEPLDVSGSLLVGGDAWAALANLPDGCAQTCVTSPPYWGLRDYGHPGQAGLELGLGTYVDGLVGLFDQVRRVLAPDGALWLNLGDSYTSGTRATRGPDKRNPHRLASHRPPMPEGLKPKDLVGVPWRVAFALQDRGWFLRTEIVWRKPNAQPESVRDRPMRCHEYLFLLTPSQNYWYDMGASVDDAGRRLRSVWDLANSNKRIVDIPHPAVFPVKLAERCVRITSRPGDVVLDPFLGSGTTAVAAARLGRRFVGVELNPDYLGLARRRLSEGT